MKCVLLRASSVLRQHSVQQDATITVQDKTKQKNKNIKCISGSALQYRSTAQQPDCMGKVAIGKTTGV